MILYISEREKNGMKEEVKYEIKKGTYEDYIKWNGLRMANKPTSLDIKNGVAKFYMVFKGEEYFSDFLVFESDGNMINLNTAVMFEKYLNEAIDVLKNEYDYVTFSTNDELYHNVHMIRESCNVVEDIEKEFKGYNGILWKLNYLNVDLKS